MGEIERERRERREAEKQENEGGQMDRNRFGVVRGALGPERDGALALEICCNQEQRAGSTTAQQSGGDKRTGGERDN
jgi:hypothetical protein